MRKLSKLEISTIVDEVFKRVYIEHNPDSEKLEYANTLLNQINIKYNQISSIKKEIELLSKQISSLTDDKFQYVANSYYQNNNCAGYKLYTYKVKTNLRSEIETKVILKNIDGNVENIIENIVNEFKNDSNT